MTGFGSSESVTDWGKVVLEIQTINRRHLEVHMQLPKEFSSFELSLRKLLEEVLYRGQVTFRMRVNWDEKKRLPSLAFLQKLKLSWDALAKGLKLSEEVTLSFLMDRMKELNIDWEPKDPKKVAEFLQELTKKALKKTLEMRKKEGSFLQKDIELRLKNIEKRLKEIKKKAPLEIAKDKKKLEEKIASFLPKNSAVDTHLIREVASFAEKGDITEEIVRFFSHIKQFQVILQKEKGAVGRKLDFLVQEMMREANTVCAKSSSPSMIASAVEIKADLERIKEQIQNVE